MGSAMAMLQTGDRTVEYPFVLSKIDITKNGRILDVGCTFQSNYLAPTFIQLGWDVYGIDLRKPKLEHPNFYFVNEDIRKTSFPDDYFDYVYAVSTLEHVGLSGRYGVMQDDAEGDFDAVREINRILRPDGALLITVPFGQGDFCHRLHRLYTVERIKRLFSGWKIIDEVYSMRNNLGMWNSVPGQVANEARWAKNPALALIKAQPAE